MEHPERESEKNQMRDLSQKCRMQIAGEMGVADKTREAETAREGSPGHMLWISGH